MSQQEASASEQAAENRIGYLAAVAALSTCIYGIIAILSWRFDYELSVTQRPIVPVLLLFAAAFAGYLFAVRTAMQTAHSRKLLGLILWFAVIFRAVLLFSVPIQEIDIYRYLWDGATLAVGVSPFRYSPQQVLEAEAASTNDEQLLRVVRLRDNNPALRSILSRVHFAELPTVYPPASQAVFAAAALTTPDEAPVYARLFIMKAWLLGFDLATLLVVIQLLKLCQKPVELCVIYAWCPLLLKEIANSGHLDAVAVFLTTLAVYLAASGLPSADGRRRRSMTARFLPTLAAIVLALAVGAKLYPIVLAPLFFLVFARQLGWRRVLLPSAAFAAITVLVLWPMLPRAAPIPQTPKNVVLNTSALESQTRENEGAHDAGPGSQLQSTQSLPPPAIQTPAALVDPSLGMKTFLRRWEMNDLIFLVLVENLKPMHKVAADHVAWFSVAPEAWRVSLNKRVAEVFGVEMREAPFFTARAITAAVFLVVAIALAWRAARTSNPTNLCEAGFLTLAWFWLLCPTQNPWYWTWALPLLPFARSRVWLAVSGLALLYYLRFWLSYHWTETPVWGGPYVGSVFFDFVVTWIEFAPWFVCLALSFAFRKAVARNEQ